MASEATTAPAPSQTGSGGTGPGETVVWGVLSRFARTGSSVCLSSPDSICNGAGFPPPPYPQQHSATYDLGTWSFDATADFEAAPYLERTGNGGLANTQWDPRGTFVGAGVPALPLLGFVVMGAGLLAAGWSVRRR